MPKKNPIRRFALIVSILALCAVFNFAQNPSPNQKPINAKKEDSVNKSFKIWEDEDVKYIITKEEKDAFDKLKTNEERENFIATFWQRRDPNPDTEENEYREEYYERIAFANEHFASGIPGWRTDRGRIYITWGKPDSIEAHPSGGSYDRPSYEGGGSTSTYPFETWFYRHLDGVGDGLEVEFVDPTGTGEYHIARNANEKDALLQIPGAGLTLSEQLGLSNKGDRSSGINNANYQRAQDSPFAVMERIILLEKAPQNTLKNNPFISDGNVLVQNENSINFDLRVDFFRLSDDRVITAFTVQSDNKEFTFNQLGGLPTAKINIFGKITSVSGKQLGTFEDSATTTATTQELAEARNRKSIYQKVLPLPPGIYKIDVAVRDVETGKTGFIKQGFTVPKYDKEKLTASTLILASRLYQTTEKDIGGQFIIGDKKVVPNLPGIYKKGQEVGIYLQVYNSGIDQTTLKPAIEVEYILLKDGKEILRQAESWEDLNSSNERLILARLIPTEKLAVGNYEIKVKIFDRVNNQTLEPAQKFTIVQ